MTTPDAHTTDPISVRYPAVDEAWLRSTAERRGVSMRSILIQALASARLEDGNWNPVELLELLTVVLEAVDIPYAACQGDEEIRAVILANRLMLMIVAVRAILERGPKNMGWAIGALRQNLAGHPFTGLYRTDYAQVIADVKGITLEQARLELAGQRADVDEAAQL